MIKSKRRLLLLLSIFLICITTANIYAWVDDSQSKTNEFKNEFTFDGNIVILNLYRKDASGNQTNTTLSGAQFYLYKKSTTRASDTQIGNLYFTDSNGMILVDNLIDGSYYFVEETPPYGYKFDVDSNGASITNYSFEFNVNRGAKEIITAYNIALEGILEVSKTVDMQSGTPLTPLQLSQEFKFIIKFNDGKSYEYYKSDPTILTSLNSGGTFKLKHGESIYFVGIPVGVQYEVIESPTAKYALSSSENHQSNIPLEGIKALFTNTYLDIDNSTSLIIKKDIISNNPIDTQKMFEFKVSFSDNSSYSYYIDNIDNLITINSGDTIGLKHQEQATFINLPLGITYIVTEEDYTIDNYIANVQSINGTLINSINTIQFINYDNNGSVISGAGSLKIDKQVVDNRDIDIIQEFEFKIKFNNNSTYSYLKSDGSIGSITSGDVIKLKHDENIVISDIATGTKYEVEELKYTANNYRPNIIKQSGSILDNYETLINVINWRSQQKITIKKQVINKTKEDTFDFKITVNGKVSEFKLKDNEEISLDLNYGDTYLVSEKDYANDNYLQSITNGHGTITYNDINTIQYNKWLYTIPTRLGINIEFTKELIGDEPIETPRYRFILKPLTNSPMPSNTVDNHAIITMVGSSTLTYENIVYTKPGVYYYSIKEIDDKLEGYTYDKSEYIIEVIVSKVSGTSGDLVNTIKVTKNNIVVNKIVFTNQYKSPTTTPIIPNPVEPVLPSIPGGNIISSGMKSSKLLYGTIMMLINMIMILLIRVRNRRGINNEKIQSK